MGLSLREGRNDIFMTKKEEIQYQDFDKVDIRVGQVVAAVIPEWSEKLIELTVDFGEEIGQKTILAGVKQWYQAEDFIDHLYPFIVNLAERKMGPGVSQGMMLMVDEPGQPVPIKLDQGLTPGSILR